MNKYLLAVTLTILSGCANLFQEPNCTIKTADLAPIAVKSAPIQKFATVIYYADGSAELSDADRKELKQVANKANQNNADLLILGHASTKTRPVGVLERKMINLNISNRRALTVVRQLSFDGVPLSRMRYQALADSRLAKPETDTHMEALNRRVEIFYVY